MADNRIDVVIKLPGELPQVVNIPNTLGELQSHVGGYIEAGHMGKFVPIYNEDGLALGLPRNVRLDYGTIVGTIIVTKANRAGDFVSLTVAEQAEVIKMLRAVSI